MRLADRIPAADGLSPAGLLNLQAPLLHASRISEFVAAALVEGDDSLQAVHCVLPVGARAAVVHDDIGVGAQRAGRISDVFWKDVMRDGGEVQSFVFFDHFTTLIPRLRARLMVVLLYAP